MPERSINSFSHAARYSSAILSMVLSTGIETPMVSLRTLSLSAIYVIHTSFPSEICTITSLRTMSQST